MLAAVAVLLAAAGGHFVNLPFASLQGAALAAPPISSDATAINARDFMARLLLATRRRFRIH